MILLKANGELENIFKRMLGAMKVNVTWNGKFVVLNNFLILSGSVRSLVFNFDNRKVLTNVIELPDREEDTVPVEDNEFLSNVLNMALYAFGKWGVIKGIRVEQDYSQLNQLFQGILKDMKITPGFRDDNFRFYKDGIQITYEEVVQAAVEEGKRKAQEAKKEEEEQSEHRLGLWHNICWKTEQSSFSKSELSVYEKQSERLGNNFYLTGMHCPLCKEKLFMAVYPEGKEFPVDTEEGKVYLARAYTCRQCSSFYTPRPGKLLIEGDVYALKFGSDQDAYEDYQELLGRDGERTSNYHFNEYEWERGKSKPPQSLERECADMEDMDEAELLALDEKLETGFYPAKRTEPYHRRIQELLRRKKADRKLSNQEAAAGRQEDGMLTKHKHEISSASGQERTSLPSGSKEHPFSRGNREIHQEQTAGKNRDAASESDVSFHSPQGWKEEIAAQQKDSSAARTTSEVSNPKLVEKYEARMRVLDRMSFGQLSELKRQVQSEKALEDRLKADYISEISKAAAKREEEAVRKKVQDCQNKPYGVLGRTIEEVRRSQAPENVKQEALQQLEAWRIRRGQEEVKQLMDSAPANMNHSQYRAFREKLAQYQDVDLSSYEGQLEEKRQRAEKLELDQMRGRLHRSDRKSLMNMLSQLKEGFSEEQAAPVRREIEDRLRKLDEAAIDKICPNIMGMTFEEAAEAYEKIEGGAFLPELKTDTLEMIDKRLTKLKMDECGLLVEKLKEELKGKIQNTERLHFYEVRKVMRGDWEPREAELAACALNTYAADRSRYEFPILICDSSARKNGKEGFLLTPDHIYYNSTFNSEKIPVRAITGIQGNAGILNRGLYINRGNGEKTKIPGGVPAKELGALGKILDSFVSYLQEKPESRSIAYLAKKTHEVTCCYRCGFTYQGGNICPKCGNQANQ